MRTAHVGFSNAANTARLFKAKLLNGLSNILSGLLAYRAEVDLDFGTSTVVTKSRKVLASMPTTFATGQ